MTRAASRSSLSRRATDGRIDAGLLGQAAQLFGRGAEGDAGVGRGQPVAAAGGACVARGIDLAQAGGLRLFGADTPAGTKAELVAADEGWVVICAPGLPMTPDAQDTATPVTVLVHAGRRPAWWRSMTCPTRWPTRCWTCG